MTRPTGRWSFGRKGGFCYDVELEALLALREPDRARWEALGPALKVKLAFYEGTRQVYEDSIEEQALEVVRRDAAGDPYEEALTEAVTP